MSTNNRELAKTLVIGENTYNINAVQASKLEHSLAITEKGINEDTPFEFNGSEDKSIEIVPASGGKFSGNLETTGELTVGQKIIAGADLGVTGDIEVAGKITVSNNSNLLPESLDKTVLNYHDTMEIFIENIKNHSALYSWDGNEFAIIQDGASPNGISIIQGTKENLDSFVTQNYYTKYLSVFLYICTDKDLNAGQGQIYIGTSNKLSYTRIGQHAETAKKANIADEAVAAEKATKLENSRQLEVNLTNKKTVSKFDGTTDLQLAITGILPRDKGGLGLDLSTKSGIIAAEYLINSHDGATTTTFDTGIEDYTAIATKNTDNPSTTGYFKNRSGLAFWNYIKSKLLGNDERDKDLIIPISNGGTGADTKENIISGRILTFDSNGVLKNEEGNGNRITVSPITPQNAADPQWADRDIKQDYLDSAKVGDIWIVFENPDET